MTAAPSSSGTTPVILARSLIKEFGPVRAVDGIDLSIARGESVLLLGANGAGKSTLLRIFATLVRPTSGSLAIHGQEIAAAADRLTLRRHIGLLSHRTFLYDHLTGLENLEFHARLHGLDNPRGTARAALRDAGLESRRHDLVRGYSRGMQQRLAIARAMLHRPDILLLDEPFTGLDREASDRLQDALRPLERVTRTCVVATHDFTSGVALSTRIVVLASGRVVADRPSRGLDVPMVESLFRSLTAEDRAAGAA